MSGDRVAGANLDSTIQPVSETLFESQPPGRQIDLTWQAFGEISNGTFAIIAKGQKCVFLHSQCRLF